MRGTMKKCGPRWRWAALGTVRREGRSRFRAEVRGDRRADELVGGSTLLTAGLNHRPDAFAPALAVFAAGALCDPAMDRHKANRLFRQVVRRFDIRLGDETEVAFRVLVETVRQVFRFARLRRQTDVADHSAIARHTLGFACRDVPLGTSRRE